MCIEIARVSEHKFKTHKFTYVLANIIFAQSHASYLYSDRTMLNISNITIIRRTSCYINENFFVPLVISFFTYCYLFVCRFPLSVFILYPLTAQMLQTKADLLVGIVTGYVLEEWGVKFRVP
jgi:hypothetical protein